MNATTRPAESMAKNAAIGGLVAYALGVNDPEQLACIVAVVGIVPGVVTTLVANGGIRGCVRALWAGRTRR
jgi:hypothetical protein